MTSSSTFEPGLDGPRWSTLPPTRSLVATGAIVAMIISSIGIGSFMAVASDRLQGLEVPLLAVVLMTPALVWAAIKRFDAMVFLAAALMWVVQREPAPVDLLIFLLFPIGILTGRLDLKRLKNADRLNTLVWIFVFLTLASVAVADLAQASTRFALITIYCIGIAYFVKLYVATSHDMGRLVGGYVFGALLAMGLVILDLVGIFPDEIVIQQGRSRGLTKDPNVFAPALIPVLLILIDEAWRPFFTRRLPRLLIYGAGALVVLGIFTSFSRAAWANTVLTLALYGAFNLRYLSTRQRMTVLRWIAATGLGIVVFMSLAGLGQFFAQRANVLQDYDSERFAAQRTATELGLLHPIGIGPGMSHAGDLMAPHSVYLRTWAETGALSLIVFLMLMLAFILPYHDRSLIDSRVFGVSASVLVATSVGQMVNGLVIDTLHWRHFWLLMGMVWLGHSVRSRGWEDPSRALSEVAA